MSSSMSKELKRNQVECEPSSSDQELVFNTPEKKRFKTIIVRREKPEVKIVKDPFALRYIQKNEELRKENIELRSENKQLRVRNKDLDRKNKGLEEKLKELEGKNKDLEEKNKDLKKQQIWQDKMKAEMKVLSGQIDSCKKKINKQ